MFSFLTRGFRFSITKAQNFWMREHTPIRRGFRASKILLKKQDDFNKKLEELDRLKNNSSVIKNLRKTIQTDANQAKKDIQIIRKELSEIFKDEALILFFLTKSIAEVALTIDKLKAKVPSVEKYLEKANKELTEIVRVAHSGEYLETYVQQHMHIQKNAFPREMYNKMLEILKEEKEFDSGMRLFHKALRDKLASELNKGSGDVETAFDIILGNIKIIMMDTIAFVKIFIDEIHNLIKEEKDFLAKDKHMSAIAKDEKWAEKEFILIMAEAKQALQTLKAAPASAIGKAREQAKNAN